MAWADGGGEAPSSITVQYEGLPVINGKIVAGSGDTFRLRAYDQDGKETPVTWKNESTWACTVNETTGEVTIIAALGSGSTSYMYFSAVSTLNPEVKSASIKVEATGYQISDSGLTVTLSEDGQIAKTVDVRGGVSGYNQWSYDAAAADGIASAANDPGTGSSMKFNCFRPGSFDVSVKVDSNETLTDTKTVFINGVAVETEAGERTKTYLTMSEDGEKPEVQLIAFCESGKSITRWTSSNEQIATVDETGKVTAQGIGTAIIRAEDNAGGKGGIKVVVESSDTPYFEGLEFMTSALENGAWKSGETFSPTRTSYVLPIRTYSTSTLTLLAGTLYNTDKYAAAASYTDINGKELNVAIGSGSQTKLEGIPFDSSELKITIWDKVDTEHKTEYVFHVTRPRDTTKTIKSNGIVLSPVGRSLTATKYNGQAEGTMFRASEDGSLASGTGVYSGAYWYRTYALDELKNFKLNITGNTAYTHIRYSTDGGETWKELAQGGGITAEIAFPEKDGEENPVVKTRIQILDDKTYDENVKAGKDGFEGSGEAVTEYVLWTEQLGNVTAGAQITEAATEEGDWYPAFRPGVYTYNIVVPNGTTAMELKYKAAENAVVKLGSAVQEADASGYYTLSLKTSAQTLTVTSEKGVVNTYSFKLQAKSKYDVPDKVVDYLCINSQYTNGGYGIQPEVTLGGLLKSLGNFGGYITYYYENGLVDDPNNKYGIDFYVYGNANKDTSTATKTSFFEPGQVWVSEDGSSWYALAGSAHYEDGVDWNYTVEYRKLDSGKTAWTDSRGNSNEGKSYTGNYPSAEKYYLNQSVKSDVITLSGIILPARSGDIAVSGQATDAYPIRWGYADCFANSTLGVDVNPYLDNSNFDLQTNGFDLEWAVDEEGNPIDVSNREFHYVKIQTASNIWHTSFGEKSTEITSVIRTAEQSEAVGRTNLPGGVSISDGSAVKNIAFHEGQQIYEADLGDMKYVSIAVKGAAEDANIYVNNERIGADGAAEGIKVTKESGTKLVRILVQEGEKEPQIILLKLTGSAEESDELIEGVKINVSGTGRQADTVDGTVYTSSVGHRIDKIGIVPVMKSSASYTVNGSEVETEYVLEYGENLFEIAAEDETGKTQTVTLKITREEAPPVSENKITVYFVLYGDELHGDNGTVHTYRNDRSDLEIWAPNKAYEVPEGSTVLDVFEQAASFNNLTYVNVGGNYISSVNGLSEFSNGSLSGWMYLLNGSHPEFGIAEQIVKNGDQIVFHYTDDYTKEEGSEKWDYPYEPGTESAVDEVTADDGQDKLDKLIRGVKNTTLKVTSKKVSKGIQITWTKSRGYKVDYYEVFRSTKRYSGFGKTAFYTTKNAENPTKTWYVNTKDLKEGTRYYYKVRGVRMLDGEKYYTQWSSKAWRIA